MLIVFRENIQMAKKISNPNSPDNLLGKWFEQIEIFAIDHDLIGTEQEYVLARGCIAHILEFADQHNKLIQMYNWLISNEGDKFLQDHSRPSQLVSSELKDLSFDINWENYILHDEVNSIAALREWMGFFAYPLPSQLKLKLAL